MIAQLSAGQELRGLAAWPVPGLDLAIVDGVGVTAELRDAATVMLVRDGDEGLEVFMLRRTGMTVAAERTGTVVGSKSSLMCGRR